MTKCVIYVETTPHWLDRPVRHYMQEAGSLGIVGQMWRKHPQAGMFSLDSRVMVFNGPKEAAIHAMVFSQGKDIFIGEQTIGYHGITENGNACPPFKVVQNGVVRDALEWMKHYDAVTDLELAYRDSHLPLLISSATTAAAREGEFSYSEMLDNIDYLLVNLVEEELTKVQRYLHMLELQGCKITDLDCFGESVNIYYTQTMSDTKPRHFSVTICALNLLNEEQIQYMKEGIVREKLEYA